MFAGFSSNYIQIFYEGRIRTSSLILNLNLTNQRIFYMQNTKYLLKEGLLLNTFSGLELRPGPSASVSQNASRSATPGQNMYFTT